MTLGGFFNLLLIGLLLYSVIGISLFALAGNELMDLVSREAQNFILYWPLILEDALSGYTPSF